jgi:hypothetical protein
MENGRLDETRLVLLQCPRPTDIITHLYLYQLEIDEVHKGMYVALAVVSRTKHKQMPSTCKSIAQVAYIVQVHTSQPRKNFRNTS